MISYNFMFYREKEEKGKKIKREGNEKAKSNEWR